MNDLTSTNISMTSREVSELTGKQHKHVLRDIDVLVESLGPKLGSGFKSCTYLDSNGIERRQYQMDRDSTVCLVTGYDAIARMRVIKRWQELEARQTTAIALPDFTDPVAAARAWADAKEAERTAQATATKALEHLEAAKPAIEFHERVGEADSLHSIDEAAKALQAPPRKFRSALKTQLDLFRQDGLPRQEYLDRGYVRVVETLIRLPSGDKPYPQTFFTGKGLQWIQRRIDHLLMGAEI
jgi:phage antirepressor YoqD-like protein